MTRHRGASWASRLLMGSLAFAAVLLIGYALGIHPTFAEVILVGTAAAISNGIQEALR